MGLANAKPPKAVQNEAPATVSMSAPVETGSTPYLPNQPEPQYERPVVPPRVHRGQEYDQLSRVDTNEREHADRELSTFDQGPLLDQPAFMPPETPTRTEFATPAEEMPPPPMNIHAAVTMGREESSADEEEGAPLTEQVSPTDRWAQIRKNAAERALKQEEQTSRSRTETRTDDGETSGEESKSQLAAASTSALLTCYSN